MSDHKIVSVRVHTVSVPAKAVHSHGSGDVSGINAVLLELTTDTGITGWGEASPWPVFTGTVEANAAALHVHLRPHLIGQDPIQVEVLMNRAGKVLVGHNEAKAALECALLDITGQAVGLSIAELVGGRQRDAIPMSFSIANPDFGKDLEDIAVLWADGVRLFKLKTGFAEHSFDVMRLERLRELYGEEASLRIDYNQGLPAYDAIRRVRDLERFKPTFVEQPVKMYEREAMAEITRAVDVPIMADESIFDPREALRGAQARIADIFALKLAKAGGIRRALEVAAIARAAGIEVYGGCMFETSIAHAAGAHLMAAVPDLILGCEFYMSTYYAEADLATEPFPVRNGLVHIPTGPGLGVVPDPDMLARYRLELLE
ncbi:MAG: cycloisomerase [Aquamicrobium sp.]|uniref:enolase C-terminal domain-like protein n=1 Tax=Aquamicrobium sp. TaxID=1872579 RepID=UPI00349EC0A4|nr:cycloisomerase [Aquamicrobium sp.]MCO5158553.1 cycloisomerase [Aquamicrobium sp.]